MRVSLIVALVALQALAVLGQTLNPLGANPCASPPCPVQITGTPKNQLTPTAAAPCTQPTGCPAAKPMVIAKVEKEPNPFCDCILKPECDCRKVDTVEPELKEPVNLACPCVNNPGDCGCRPSNYHLVKDTCGCYHLKVCPCRREYIEPETKEKHMEPELRDRAASTACGCLAEAQCPCRVDTVTPEIKEPPCPCMNAQNDFCACAGLRRN